MVARFGNQVVDRVHAYLGDDGLKRAYRQLHRKALLVIVWYVLSYLLILLAQGWILGILACISLALAVVAVGFNIQHDANHNAFFPTRGKGSLSKANQLAGLSMNTIGGSSKRWIEGHVYAHHANPNVVGIDDDIELVPFARLAPSQKRRPWHAFQQYYMWALYTVTTTWFIFGDVVSTVRASFEKDRFRKSPSAIDYLILAASKILFGLAFFVVPLLLHPWWIVLIGAITVLALSGFLLGIVFQLAHAVEEAEFDNVTDREKVRWHEWQVRATVNFCHQGAVARIITWYTGGLNFQVEHHLFPELPHTIYPKISPIVMETFDEFGIRYNLQPTLRAALRSHYQHLRTMGKAPTPALVRVDS